MAKYICVANDYNLTFPFVIDAKELYEAKTIFNKMNLTAVTDDGNDHNLTYADVTFIKAEEVSMENFK